VITILSYRKLQILKYSRWSVVLNTLCRQGNRVSTILARPKHRRPSSLRATSRSYSGALHRARYYPLFAVHVHAMAAHRVSHICFALITIFMIMGMVHCSSPHLPDEQLPTKDTEVAKPRAPSPQEIVCLTYRKSCMSESNSFQAASMNTHWDTWEEAEEHCKNICEASWIACRLRQCEDVPGVRRPDEL
jgi:hypothetical protein